MEVLKFETTVEAQSQLDQLKDMMDSIPNIIEWCVDYFSNHFLLSVKGVNIKAPDIIHALDDLGIEATQVYEE